MSKSIPTQAETDPVRLGSSEEVPNGVVPT
jgi:hypothetical protein